MIRPNLAASLIVAAFLLCSNAHRGAQADSTPTSAFKYRRPILIEKAGPQRLGVDLDLLSGAAAGMGLADLRLYDGAGREIPYLLVPPEPVADIWREAKQIVRTPASRDQSGFEVDLGSVVTIDRLRVGGLSQPLLKRVSLEGAADHAHYNVLAADETIFDLPDQGLVRLDIDFIPGQYRYLRARWDDRATSQVPLPRQAAAHLSPPAVPAVAVTESLPFEKRSHVGQTSRFRIRLPGKALPIAALALEVAETELHRDASITEPRLSGRTLEPVTLGKAVLKRQSHGDLFASELRIPITPPVGAEMDLVVDDGDNPPLNVKAVSAVLAPQPFVYFEAKDALPVEARFGNAKLRAPKYDLEVTRESLPARPSPARWGALRQDSATTGLGSSPEAVPSVLLSGAPLDAAAFSYQRVIEPGPAGLVSMRIDAAVLAHSPGLGDVRILDIRNRQVPYLLEKDEAPLSIDLVLEGVSASELESLPPRRSYHRIRLPYAGLPGAHLEITTPVRVFTRNVSVWSELRERGREGKGKRWHRTDERTFRHTDATTSPPPLRLSLPEGDLVVLAIDDGDNDALAVTSAALIADSYRLRFFRATGADLRLVYGSPGTSAPQYDLSLLQAELEGASAAEATLGPEQAAASKDPDRQSKWFWVVFGVAVVALLGLIARLVRRAELPHSP